MAERIKDLKSYRAHFPQESQRKRAHELALDIRKFEIELYWKRATYFWTLIAATFGAYFALSAAALQPILSFLVSCIGLVLSTSWYLVNRGSKYWQGNWEHHVEALEDELAGPLYKATISNQQFRRWSPLDGYPFSVSKVNQLASLFVALLWVGLAVASFPPARFPASLVWAVPYVLAVVTLLFLYLLLFRTHGGSQGKDREVDFYLSPLIPSKKR